MNIVFNIGLKLIWNFHHSFCNLFYNVILFSKVDENELTKKFKETISALGKNICVNKQMSEFIFLFRKLLNSSIEQSNHLINCLSSFTPLSPHSDLCALFSILGGEIVCSTSQSLFSVKTSQNQMIRSAMFKEKGV